jgi:hypothetical protein
MQTPDLPAARSPIPFCDITEFLRRPLREAKEIERRPGPPGAREYCESLGLDPEEMVWGQTTFEGVRNWFQMERWRWYTMTVMP